MRLNSCAAWMGAFIATVLLLVPSLPAQGKPREGDVLRLFGGQRVYVITNADEDAPALADALLDGCPIKERRVLTLDEWNALPRETRWYVTCVYLIDRERLPASAHVPESCRAEDTETWTDVMRTGREWGVAYDVTLSAPDLANLKRAIAAFRHLKEAPKRGAVTENVHSLAVVPVGEGAARAVLPYLGDTAPSLAPPHVVPVEEYGARANRMLSMDEVVLVDRSTASFGELPTAFAPVADKLTASGGDVVAWREIKPGGFVRAYVSAPSAETLAGVLKKSQDSLLSIAAFSKPTVLASARDLRAVRRVAVATVKGERISDEVANRLAGTAATQLRSLDAFEVLERTGLTAILSEIALDQAGLTRANNRARVRQLAAADALLIVDLSRSEGGTQYAATSQRVTPRLGGPPRRPLEPSRLKTNISLPGKEDDPVVRAVTDSLLGGVLGKKTDEEYSAALRDYRRRTLPNWEREVADYNYRASTRRVEWRQTVVAQSTVRVSGSLRLVDLADGMVLWETPLYGSDRAERTTTTRTVTTTGEDSAEPGADDLPGGDGTLPDDLLAHAVEAAVTDGMTALKGTAILPSAQVTADTTGGATGQEIVTGRIIDIDGETVLVGMGASDGVAVGSTLEVKLSNGAKLQLTVTRARPRTCDARFAPKSNPALRAHVKIGDTVKIVPDAP